VSRHSWVCFDCQTVSRREPLTVDVRCRQCRKDCTHVGTKVPIPRQSDARAWRDLRERVQQEARVWKEKSYQQLLNELHSAERARTRAKTLSTQPKATLLLRRRKKAQTT
jgi:hypothetical protein